MPTYSIAIDSIRTGTNDIYLKEFLTTTTLHIKLNLSKHAKSN